MPISLCVLAMVIVAGGLLLSSTKAAAQTGIALRLGQPDEVTLGVDGRLTLDMAAFAPVDKSNFTHFSFKFKRIILCPCNLKCIIYNESSTNCWVNTDETIQCFTLFLARLSEVQFKINLTLSITNVVTIVYHLMSVARTPDALVLDIES